jgi:MYXO-CTERM domain-containing protein
MRSVPVALLPLIWALLTSASAVQAAELFVAPDGSDAAQGTLDAPFATLERAQEAAAPGDTVWIRGGVYSFSGTSRATGVAFTKSGTKDKPIRYFAYEDEIPIFDLFELKPQERVTGLDVRCNGIHLRGLEVRGVRQIIVGDSWGVRVRGDDNILERLHVHDNEAPGIFIASGGSNLVLNCDSHNNYDPLEDGGNGDGFGCHSTGANNVLRGCRAWWNSDDGYDFINAPGTCLVEHSWAFRNGYVPETTMAAGNGAGFKSGGFGSPPQVPASGVPRHVIRFNLAFRNRSQGFYANHHPGGLDFLNNTAFANGVNFDMLVEGGASTHKLHNNLAVDPGGDVSRFTGGEDTDNSWNLPVMVSAADFSGMDDAEALQPRAADGSLPAIKFLHLTADSDLADRGLDVGLPFVGSSPDLGAFERGSETTTAPSDAGVPAGDDGEPAADSGVAQGAAGASGSSAAGRAALAGRGGATGTAPSASGAAAPSTDAAGSAVAAAGAIGQATQSVNAGAPASSGPAAADGGCSCRIAHAGTKPPMRSLGLLLLAAAFILRRGRRRAAVSRESRVSSGAPLPRHGSS